MQIARIVRGTVSRDFGKTVSENLNKILRHNPGTKLESWQIMEAGNTSCSVLCIFSVPEERGGQEKDNAQEESGEK